MWIHNLLIGGGAVVLFTIAGGGFFLTAGPRRQTLASALAYSYLTGLAAVGASLWAASQLAGLPLARPAIAGLVLGVTAAGWLLLAVRRRRPGGLGGAGVGMQPMRRSPPPPRGFERASSAAALGLSALVSVAVLAQAVTNPVADFDGRMTWAAQARYLRAEGTVEAPSLRDPRVSISHPEYPILMPLVQVVVLELAGDDPESPAFRVVYAAMLPAILAFVGAAARRWAGRAAAAVAVVTMAALPALAFGAEGGAVSVYSDLAVAAFYGAAVLLLLDSRASLRSGLLAGLLLAAAVLTKNEGLPLAVAALAAAGGFQFLRRRRGAGASWLRGLRAMSGAAVLVLAAIALLVSWRAAIPNRDDEDYFSMSLWTDVLPGLVRRLPTVAAMVFQKLSSWPDWGLFWWLLPVVLLAGMPALRRRATLVVPLLVAALAPGAVAWLAYSVRWDPAQLIPVTWNRLLLQGVVPLMVLFGCAVREIGAGIGGREGVLRRR